MNFAVIAGKIAADKDVGASAAVHKRLVSPLDSGVDAELLKQIVDTAF